MIRHSAYPAGYASGVPVAAGMPVAVQPVGVSVGTFAGMDMRTLLRPENRRALDAKIRELFRHFAGADQRLELHEMQRLAASLAESLRIRPEVFGELSAIFYSYDFSCDGHLDETEGVMLVEGLMRAARDAMDPGGAENFRNQVGAIPFAFLENRYTIVKKLGQGGQGAVYLAADKTSSHQERVVKLYHKSDANAPVDDIIDEFQLLKSLDHPKIARTYDIFQDQGNIYVVSEPYHGGDLSNLIPAAMESGVQVTEAYMARVFKQVCDGMCFLHSKHTMHCDLKEPNVMVSGKGELANPNIVLIDFGLASVFTKGAGGVKGTPGFMPPEVWHLGLWTPKGDTFSLGVMFYRMSSFQQPFGGTTMDEIKMSTLRGVLPSPSPFAHKPVYDSLITRMLLPDFRARASVKAVSEDPWFGNALANQAPLDTSALAQALQVRRTSALHKALLTDFAQKENLSELQELGQLFISLDKDNSGTLTASEAREGLRGRMPPEQVERFVQAMVGSSGTVAYTEFMGQMLAAKQEQTDEILLKIFQDADKDGSGTLDAQELAALLQRDSLQELMQGRSASSVLREMDADGSGQVDFLEFSRAMMPRTSNARAPSTYATGDAAEYYSTSHSGWLPCRITAVHRSGAVQIDLKPQFWILARDVAYRIRRPTGRDARASRASGAQQVVHGAFTGLK